MANIIKLKRGLSSKVSTITLDDGEVVLTTDTNKLYTNKGQISPDNVYVGDTEPTDSNVKCWISPSGKIDLSSLWDQIYPVGSIYITVNAINPSVLFGGTWEQIKGKFLVGVDSSDTDFNTSEKTGGEKTHKLTQDEMPSHSHSLKYSDSDTAFGSNYLTSGKKSSYQTSTVTINDTGGGSPHNNLPPYMTVYIWKRTK